MYVNKKRKVDMDANSVISAFLASSNQYTICQNDNNLMQLQRHLEIIDCLTTTSSDLGFFQSGNPISSQCITHIVNLFLDTNVKCTLIPRALSILQNLSKCPHLNKSLQSMFHVHSAVSVFLQKYGSDFKDTLVLQCLDVLKNVTYDINIHYLESHLENLITVLLRLTDNESTQLLKSTLRILSNLIRHNVIVQNYICSLPSSKQHIKRIVVMLNMEEPEILVYALTILANLTPNFPIGAKLWTDNHLMVAFQLILKLLFGPNETCAVGALDLFLDLIKFPNYKSCFIKSPYLNSLLNKIPRILSKNKNNRSSIYLQLLNALIQIPDCQGKVCSVLYESQPESVDSHSNNVKIHPKIIQWCTNKNMSDTTTILALKLLKSIIALHIDNFNNIENSIKEAIQNILENMSIPVVSETKNENNFEAHTVIFEILILLLKRTNLKDFVTDHANVGICEEIAKLLLSVCKLDESENVSCINLFLMILEVISMTESKAPNLEKVSSNILNDHKAMQYLAYALTCNNNDSMKRALLIVSLTKSNSSIEELSKNIILRLTSLLKQPGPNSELYDCSFSVNTNHQAYKKISKMSDTFEKKIDTLLEKIEKGLSIKDFKQSEIMDLYEHKIAILTRQEQELQNYIEAKTVALQKADQIMTQYKCRQADSDAEAVRLRTIIKDFESQYEKAFVKYEEAEQKCKTQKEELDQALSKVKELQQYAKEQNELMQNQINRQFEQKKLFEEEKAKLLDSLNSKDCERKVLGNQIQQFEEEIKLKCKAIEALEESRDEALKKVEECKKSIDKMKVNFEQKQSNLESLLDVAQQTINSLEQKNENINSDFNKKVEIYSQQILELEGEKDIITEQLKLKDSKINDLNESIKNVNTQLSEKSNNLREAEILNEKLKTSLEETQSKSEKLEKDIKMLELLCKKYETSLDKKDKEIKSLVHELEKNLEESERKVEEKEKQVKNMEAELEKYKYITGMINQMTSGKIPPKHEN